MNDAKIVLAHLSVINIGEQYYERSLQDFYFFFFFHFLLYEWFDDCSSDFII